MRVAIKKILIILLIILGIGLSIVNFLSADTIVTYDSVKDKPVKDKPVKDKPSKDKPSKSEPSKRDPNPDKNGGVKGTVSGDLCIGPALNC